MVMDRMAVLLMALALMALSKVQANATESPAFRNSSECNTTTKPETRRLRLMDGGSNCSGRVEFEYDGVWGTVCDDNWDLADAGVVCRQLNCGWAIQALNASHFQKGTGPIHLDEVKCLGNESYLWDCPSEKNQDCGHKEDAGVICSEHQRWRLSGGLDACAGRVEVHYKGIWNTVCNGNWYQDEADLLCHSLGCSDKALTQKVHFSHTLPGKILYQCVGTEDSLANCKLYHNKFKLCDQFRAAGVICNGSLGLGDPTETPRTVTPASVSRLPSPALTRPENLEVTPSYQMLQILSIVLGLLLFLAVLILIITIVLNRRRKNGTFGMLDITSTIEDCAASSASVSAPVLVNHSVQITAPGASNDYREIPTSLPKEEEATTVIPTPLSEDSDSDYEHYDFNNKPPTALSTFYNSLRYRATDEDIPPCNFVMPTLYAEHESTQPASESYPHETQPTAEASDSTSSGDAEWYENIQRPEQQGDRAENKPSVGGLTTFSRPLVNREAGPGNDSFDSSDYDDMWS